MPPVARQQPKGKTASDAPQDKAEPEGSGLRFAALLMRLRVVDGELFEGWACQPKRGRLLVRAVGVPLVDDETLDHPHRTCPIACGTVDVRRLVAGRRDCLQKLIGDFRIG